MEPIITPSERRALDGWLAVVSHRCEVVTGDDLDTVACRIESSGRMTASGLRRMLAGRWRSGCCAVRAARFVLAESALAAEE